MSTKAIIGIIVVVAVLLLAPLMLGGKNKQPEIPYTGKPEIVERIPADGATDVAADLATISVRFNVPMQGGFSLTGRTPKFSDTPQWSDDKTTLTVPVSLLDGHNYTFGLNSQSFRNFVDENGIALTPTTWKFSTVSADGSPAPSNGPPKVIALDPPNSSSGVSPQASTLTITFDVPMQGGMSLMGQTPEITGKPQWSSNRKTLTVPVKLIAGHKYRFGLNSQSYRNFRSDKGFELVPIIWEFST